MGLHELGGRIVLERDCQVFVLFDVEVHCLDPRCFPGQERLAEDMGMSRSRVTEFVGELEKLGYITIQRRGQGKTNIYTLNLKVKKYDPIKTERKRSVLTKRNQPH